jgi:hypothetical protein
MKNKDFLMILLYIFCIMALLIAHGCAMHSIDLSWNAVRIEGLTDNNGIVEQTPEQMYNRGYLFIMWFPLLISIPIFGIIYIIYNKR